MPCPPLPLPPPLPSPLPSQLTLKDNTEGFLVMYNGVVLSGSKDPKAVVTIPGPQGNNSHFYVTVQCGPRPVANTTTELNFQLSSACDSSIKAALPIKVGCMHTCPGIEWVTPTSTDAPIVVNKQYVAENKGMVSKG